MKKLLVLTTLSVMTIALTGCGECWDNFWNRGDKYEGPVYCPPPCPPTMTTGCAAPACGPACGAPGYVDPGPGT